MNFYRYPGKLHLPVLPVVPLDIWMSDSGMLNIKFSEKKYIIAKNFIGNILCDGDELVPIYRNVNGYIYWKGQGIYLYYSNGLWVLSSSLGLPPDSVVGGYSGALGDPFSDTSFPFSPAGAYENENTVLENVSRLPKYTTKELKWKWERWEATEFAGIYTKAGEPSNTRTIGFPQWNDEDGTAYVCIDGNFSNILYNEEIGKWVIGEYQSKNGWWEGEKPDKEHPVTFVFTVTDGGTLSENNKILHFSGYTAGEEFLDQMICEVATWK